MKELPLQSVVNLRDFGATQTKDRKTVKSGLFLRSAALNRLSKKDAAALRDKYGVCTVIDLRTPGERREAPDRVWSREYLPMPVFDLLVD